MPGSLKGQDKIGGAGSDRNDHPDAPHDGKGLQPPGYGAEYEMMGADHRVEQYLRPKGEDPQAIGVDRPVKLLRQEIIDDTQGEHHEPHAHRLVHIIALDNGFSQPILPEGKVPDRYDHETENDR